VFIDSFDSMMHSRRRFNHLQLSYDFIPNQEDELSEVLSKFGSEIKVAEISLCQRNLKQFLKVLKRLPNVEELDIQNNCRRMRETEVEDGDTVKLAKLKRLSLYLRSVDFMNFFQELIPDGAMTELELIYITNRHENVFLSLKNFFASQLNIKKLKMPHNLNFEWIGHLKLEEFSASVQQSQQQELVAFLVTQRNLKVVVLKFWNEIESAALIQIIQSLKNVRELKFTLKRIDVESLHAIQQLQLRYLEDFELELNGNVSAVRPLEAVELSSMKGFKLSSVDNAIIELSNESVFRLAQRFSKLQEIALDNVNILNYNVILDNFRELVKIIHEIVSEEEFYMPRFEPGNIYSKLKEIYINFLYDYRWNLIGLQDEDDWQIFSDLVRASPNLEYLYILIAINSFNNGMYDFIESLPQLKRLKLEISGKTFPANFEVTDRLILALKVFERIPDVSFSFWVDQGSEDHFSNIFKDVLQSNHFEHIEFSNDDNNFYFESKKQK
jgi:hypothetical protein